MSSVISNVRPPADTVLTDIADYVRQYRVTSGLAYTTARHCLIDTLGCGLEALEYPACTKLLGPLVPGTIVPNGAKVPGTQLQLDPVQAAFNIGAMNRWLDFNDTWLAAEWGHPSDNLGGLLAVADWQARKASAEGRRAPTVRDLLTAMIKAHEIQGVTALENGYNRVGLDHVILVRVATTAWQRTWRVAPVRATAVPLLKSFARIAVSVAGSSNAATGETVTRMTTRPTSCRRMVTTST